MFYQPHRKSLAVFGVERGGRRQEFPQSGLFRIRLRVGTFGKTRGAAMLSIQFLSTDELSAVIQVLQSWRDQAAHGEPELAEQLNGLLCLCGDEIARRQDEGRKLHRLMLPADAFGPTSGGWTGRSGC